MALSFDHFLDILVKVEVSGISSRGLAFARRLVITIFLILHLDVAIDATEQV